jgi:hypothetical protein
MRGVNAFTADVVMLDGWMANPAPKSAGNNHRIHGLNWLRRINS